MKLLNIKKICKSLMYDTDEMSENSIYNTLIKSNDITSNKITKMTREEKRVQKERINYLLIRLNSKQ